MIKKCSLWKIAAIMATGLWVQPTNAQSVATPEELGEVSPPSPTVASMIKATDVPVSYFTGVPQITIPLYEINTGKLKLPISLDYQGGGIRVGDRASNVGLGWSLNATGVITQTAQGVEDNGTYQTNGLGFIPTTLNPMVNSEYQTLWSLASNSFDGVPDLFMYNFQGYGGRFINADQIRLLPQANIQFSKHLDANNNDYWKAVTPDGNQYYFGAKEKTRNRSASSLSWSYAWQLTKIVDPNHVDSILFEYENTIEEVGFGASYDKVIFPEDPNMDNMPDAPGPGEYHGFIVDVMGKQLKRIIFNNGKVELDIAWNDRADGVGTMVPRIKNLFIQDKNGSLVKAIHLEHSYFNSPGTYANTPNGNRLKLESVSFVPELPSLGSSLEEKYTLTYNTTNLPPTHSKGIDHWGFYNGAVSNPTLIPAIELPNFEFIYGAANREPNEVYSKAAILEKITYPTGGSTSFEWEANKLGITGMDSVLIFFDSLRIIDLTATSAYDFQEYSAPVTIPTTGLFQNMTHVEANFSTFMSLPEGGAGDQQIVHAGGSGKLYQEVGSNNIVRASKTFGINDVGNLNYSVNTQLFTGNTYSIWGHIKDPGFSINVKLKIKWPKMVYMPIPDTLLGGCRIKRITSYDPYNRVSTWRDFSYSGVKRFERPLYWKPITMFYDGDGVDDSELEATQCDDLPTNGYYISSNSITPFGSGGHLGYSMVTESFSGSRGKKQYYYMNFDNGSTTGEFQPAWRRGILYQTKTYTSDSVLMSKSVIKSRYGGQTVNFAGHTVSIMAQHECAPGTIYNPYFPVYFNQRVYNFPSEWILTDTVEEYDYSTGMSSIIVNNYDNAIHKNVTQSTNFASDGSKVTSFVKYPGDYSLPGTLSSNELEALKLLQDKHMDNVPIERYTQKWLSGTSSPLTIGANYSEFRTAGPGDDIILPAAQYSIEQTQGLTNFQASSISGSLLNKDSRYVEQANLMEYDKHNNLVTLSTKGSNTKGWIWGYDLSRPIAFVKNNSKNRYRGFTSFEKNANGNWAYSESAVNTSDRFTGKRALNLAIGNATISFAASDNMVYGNIGQVPSGQYIVSYWRKNGTATVNGTVPQTIGMTANGWTYCEHIITNPPSVTVTGTATIDELRFYPVGSQMESYTYDPMIGITSADNAASSIIFYEYDSVGRLSVERDVFGKVIKKHTYQYQVTE